MKFSSEIVNFKRKLEIFKRSSEIYFFKIRPSGIAESVVERHACRGEGLWYYSGPRIVTGEHWTGSPKQRHRPNRQKMSQKSETCVFSRSGKFWTFFGHFVLSDPRNRNHKSLAIANHNFEVASFSRRNRNEIAVLQVSSESQ